MAQSVYSSPLIVLVYLSGVLTGEMYACSYGVPLEIEYRMSGAKFPSCLHLC